MASRRPRWDGDPTGIGIGDARAIVPLLDALRLRALEPGWVAEDPELHLLPHLVAAAASTGRVAIAGTVADAAGSFDVDLTWIGDPEPDRKAIRTALFALVGAIVETTTAIHEPPAAAGREIELVTGSTESTAFAPHGHVVRIRLNVPAVRP
jgi:hypothetical protein